MLRACAAIALSLMLCGCFSSNGPLFSEDRGACPFAAPTTYEEIDETPYRFVFERDGGYCRTTDEEGKVTRTLFVPIGTNWWIVQGDEASPSYMMMHRTGSRLVQYAPRCQDFSETRLRRMGVTFDEDRRSCTATEARQIETLFRAWRGGFHQAVGAYRLAPAAPTTPAPQIH